MAIGYKSQKEMYDALGGELGKKVITPSVRLQKGDVVAPRFRIPAQALSPSEEITLKKLGWVKNLDFFFANVVMRG